MYVRHKLPADAEIILDERNRRVKLVACGHDPAEAAAVAVERAEQLKFEKIWGFVSPEAWGQLAQVGFRREGTLEGYFGDMPGIAVARYLSSERAHSRHIEMEDAIVDQAVKRAQKTPARLPGEYRLRMATLDDAQAVSDLLTAVFETYPTPVGTARDICEAMARDVHFAMIMHGNAVAGVASADIDLTHRVAEMTDCAVLPAYRGQGLMAALLQFLEQEIRILDLRSLYTLARATSVPMNLTFARLGYAYRGRLINNCHIAGDWEDMNLWVKMRRQTAEEAAE